MAPRPRDQALRVRPRLLVVALGLASFAYAIGLSLVFPVLDDLQRELNLTSAGASLILSAYLASAAVWTPITGRLGDMFGKDRVILVALSVFAVGLAVSAMADSLAPMVAGRVLQGAAGGVIPLTFSILGDELPRAAVAGGVGKLAALQGVGGGAGVVLAGPIVEHLGIHWLFWLPFVIVAAAMIGVRLFVPPSPVRTLGRVDVWGAVLMAGWLVCLLAALTRSPREGWTSPDVLLLGALAAVLLAVWIVVEARRAEPLVDVRLMRSPAVAGCNVAALGLGVAMYGSLMLVPRFVRTSPDAGYGFGATAAQSGSFLLPLTLGTLVAGFATGRLTAHIGSRLVCAMGALFGAAALVVLCVAHSDPWQVYVAMAWLGIGTGFSLASLASLVLDSVERTSAGVASAMNMNIRNIGSVVGTSVCASILAAGLATDAVPPIGRYLVGFGVCAVGLSICLTATLSIPVVREQLPTKIRLL